MFAAFVSIRTKNMVLILGVVIFNIYLVLSGSTSSLRSPRPLFDKPYQSLIHDLLSSLGRRSTGGVAEDVDGWQAEGSDLSRANHAVKVADPRDPDV